jgi:hypothetical protein
MARYGLVTDDVADSIGAAIQGEAPMKTPLLWILAAGLMSMGASPVPTVEVSSGQIAIQANEVPLGDLLTAVGERAHVAIIQIQGQSTSRKGTVTDSFSNLPLEQGIRRLLHDVNYVLEKDGNTIKRVFILGSGQDASEHGETVRPPRTSQSLQPVEMLSNLQSESPEQRLAALGMMHSRGVGDTPLADLRILVERDPDPRVQAAAFDLLVRHDTSVEWKQTLTRLASEPGGSFQDAATQELEHFRQEAAAAATAPPSRGR